MPFKLFEFLDRFTIGAFLKLTKFEKTGSIRKTFISLGNLIINFHFRNQRAMKFFVTFTLLLFDSGAYLLFNNGHALNLKINHKSNREKSKLSVTNFKTFS